MNPGLHIRQVPLPFRLFRTVEQKRVCIGIQEDAPGLPVNDAGEHGPEFVILPCQAEVGPDLGGRVAEPHGLDVAGDHEGIGAASRCAGMDGGIQRVGEAVFEHPGQLGVTNPAFHPPYQLFKGRAGKLSLPRRGPGRREGIEGARPERPGACRACESSPDKLPAGNHIFHNSLPVRWYRPDSLPALQGSCMMSSRDGDRGYLARAMSTRESAWLETMMASRASG